MGKRKRLTAQQRHDADFQQRFSEDQETLKEWVELWASEMVNIWKAKLAGLSTERNWWVPEPIKSRVPDSRHDGLRLMDSPKTKAIIWNDPRNPVAGFTVEFTFLLYGIWVDSGSGREMGIMVRDEEGKFIGNQKGMTKKGKGALSKWTTTRKPKHWYSVTYWSSCKRLIEEMNDDYTGNFVFLMHDLQKSLSMARLQKKAKGASKGTLYL